MLRTGCRQARETWVSQRLKETSYGLLACTELRKWIPLSAFGSKKTAVSISVVDKEFVTHFSTFLKSANRLYLAVS